MRCVSSLKLETSAPPRLKAALERLGAFMAEDRKGKEGDFLNFERELHSRVMDLERELLQEELERADTDADAIRIEGVIYRCVLRAEATYQTAAGEVRVERGLYKNRSDPKASAICPLELRLGLIEGRWTPLAAQQAAWVVAHLTPAVAEDLFDRFGNQQPSRSALDRLPKQLSERWEADRTRFEERLRSEEIVPEEARAVAVSLDGVMAPMRGTDKAEQRERREAEGKLVKGPAGYKEVGCATLSFFDEEGEFLKAVRLARMPERKKATLKQMLQQELSPVLAKRPDLGLVKLADGTDDNWDFLSQSLPEATELVDFFHAAGHLSDGLAAVYGDGSVQALSQFAKWREVLKEDSEGVEKVIRMLAYQVSKHPKKERTRTALGYFRKHRLRMKYAEAKAVNLPIGSGMVEAACKTLCTAQLKGSGMRWGEEGGQAILTLRSLQQSDRFDRAWALLSATYRANVTTIAPFRLLAR
jgi:hypothetical protein